MKQFLKTALLAATLAFSQQAPAAVIDLDLTGVVSNGTFFSQTVGNTHYDYWFLALDGLTPFTVEEGDTVNATVTLDQSFTVPASVQLTVFDLFMFSNSFPAIPTGASDIEQTFFNAGTPTTSSCGETTTSGQIAAGCVYPSGTPFSFDTFKTSFTIKTLGTPVQIENATISYTLFSPAAAVPEPATWAMMLFGFALVGSALRSRRRDVATA